MIHFSSELGDFHVIFIFVLAGILKKIISVCLNYHQISKEE